MVRLRISDVALREMLRLPEGTALAGAGAEHMGASWPPYSSGLVLILNVPGAPEGAVEMSSVYRRERIEVPDRIDLTSIDWTTVHQDITSAEDPLDGLRRTLRAEAPDDTPQGGS
jgi:hypothetical protein